MKKYFVLPDPVFKFKYSSERFGCKCLIEYKEEIPEYYLELDSLSRTYKHGIIFTTNDEQRNYKKKKYTKKQKEELEANGKAYLMNLAKIKSEEEIIEFEFVKK